MPNFMSANRSRRIDMNDRPILIFWELTKACKLKCKHCRAEAISEPLPGELSTEEGKRLIDDIASFGKPSPVLILTGGDPLMREDLEEILEHIRRREVRAGIAPAVTELLPSKLDLLRKYGIRYVSISLDGMKETHDDIRGVKDHFEATLRILKELANPEWILQVNTLVTKETVYDLPKVAKLLHDLGVKIWELFFLIKVGRGIELRDLSPQESEDVVHFLYEVAARGFEVRTVEAPFFRRVAMTRGKAASSQEEVDEIASKHGLGNLYRELTGELIDLLGSPTSSPELRSAYTRDGYGVIFVAYNGEIYPSGFAPYALGNVRTNSLVDVYRNNEMLRKIRAAEFKGRCGICEFRHVCGGSRARALSFFGDILEEDPACPYIPSNEQKIRNGN